MLIGEENKKKPRGWKAMPFILGNETFERLATFGLTANFMVYLMKEFQMEQVSAANVLNIWGGITNFAPLIGAFLSDAYFGRFNTIAFASFSSLLGMATLTLQAWLPSLHPPKCHPPTPLTISTTGSTHCETPTAGQLGFLYMCLGFLSIGTGGIRPCSVPFGVDQFDSTTTKGQKGISSFYNWYYTSFNFVLLISSTLVVYIQDSISWVLGFAIPTLLMLCAIVLFFVGTSIYVHHKVEGSTFSGIGQVFVAAYRKRRVKLPTDHGGEIVENGVFYDPPNLENTLFFKLPLTNQCRFLNKAAKIEKNDLNHDGSCANPWRLCSIQQVEEVKCLFKIAPIYISGIFTLVSITQQGIFSVSQALKMDKHLARNNKFEIPAGSISVISMLTLGIWLPLYNSLLVPPLRKITKHDNGITLLQRVGVGIILSILAMVVSGYVERERSARANANLNGAPISVMWLAPQLVIIGLCEAFSFTAMIEFCNKESPENMKSIANSFFTCSFAGANYLSSFVITMVHRFTRTEEHQDWLTNNLNEGKLDYFYFLLAGIGIMNLFYFIFCARRYHYKSPLILRDVSNDDLELTKA